MDPFSIAQGDLNGDGLPDLVCAGPSGVSILFGNADGTFRPAVLINRAISGTVVVADFNGDGNNDIAFGFQTLRSDNGVSVVLGDGTGHFGPPVDLIAGNSPDQMIATDFNGDHKIDIAVANFGSNDVSVFLGNGDGTFAPAEIAKVGGQPIALAAGDFNRDGHVDLAVTNSGIDFGTNGNSVAILLGTGKGTFQPAVFIPVANNPSRIAVSDFNKDGNQDLIVSIGATGQVAELLGNGDGTFQAPRFFAVFPGSSVPLGTQLGPQAMSVDDLNGDGNADLLVVNPGTSTVAVMLGDGRGNFKEQQNIQVALRPDGIVTGDYNHDGKLDFITSNANSQSVSVVLGRGNAMFVAPEGFPNNAVPEGPMKIVTGDFNGDGIPDLATANSGTLASGHTVSVLLGREGGGFERQEVLQTGNAPTDLAVADINGDGRLDLVAAVPGALGLNPGGLSFFLGNGDGTFQPATNIPAGNIPSSLVVADFNGDEKPDIVVSNRQLVTGGTMDSILLLPNDGKGAFGTPVHVVAFPLNDEITNLFTADFNGDGNPDLAYLILFTNDTLAIQLGNGDGTFQAPKIVTTVQGSFSITAVSIGDFNNDGIPDFAIEEPGAVEILLGDGNGNFTSKGKFADPGLTVPSLVLADFNGDGLLDVASTDAFLGQVALFLGNGDGTLESPVMFGGATALGALTADFNGDGRPDIAISAQAPLDESMNPGEVLILLNTTQK